LVENRHDLLRPKKVNTKAHTPPVAARIHSGGLNHSSKNPLLPPESNLVVSLPPESLIDRSETKVDIPAASQPIHQLTAIL
jgi:hypothetical protein